MPTVPYFLLGIDSWGMSSVSRLRADSAPVRPNKSVVLHVQESRSRVSHEGHTVWYFLAFPVPSPLLGNDVTPGAGSGKRVAVLDFVDACWNVPLRHSDPGFFTGKIAASSSFFYGPHGFMQRPVVLGSYGLSCAQVCPFSLRTVIWHATGSP